MSGRFCQECGAPNEAVARYCAKCGVELRAGVPPTTPAAPSGYAPAGPPPPLYAPYPYAPPYPPAYGPAYGPPYPYPGPYPSYVNYADLERQKQIDRTKTGLLLLTVGFLIAWVPLIGAVGGFLSLVGAILVILGRKAFGDRHSMFVLVSVVLYIASIVLAVIFFVWFLIATFQSVSQGSPRPFLEAFWPFVGGVIVAAALAGIAEVLFVHELERPLGRYLLYGALVAAVAIPIAAILVLLPAFTAVLDGIRDGTITNPNDPRLAVLESVGATLGLLSIVPSVLFGIAYFLAWQRIDRREIPGAPAPPGAPPWAASTPPTPYTPTPAPPPQTPPPAPPPAPPPIAPPP